ncbi:uncharacterized protein [Arachis hypogaea]|uniref:uncharacterized protein n=1 Tax=Arachis hypogaea TaxID=3818 RepID=UPI003B224CDF
MAEYEALILGLEILIGKGALEVQIFGDSQLVLKQLSKEFKCNNEKLQVSKQSSLPVDDYWNAIFDELNELDSERILTLENIVRQKVSIARSYNHRIKEKSFDIGELVLKVILPMEKKSKFLGKWSHAWEGHFQVIGTYSGNAY